MAVKAIVPAVNMKCVKELKEGYVGLKKLTIKKMVTQIRTWYVITTKENLAIKSHFLTPWSDNPEAHVTTFACQLDMRQVKCKEHGVTITKNKRWTTIWPRCTPVACSRPNLWMTGRRNSISHGRQHTPNLRDSSTRGGENSSSRSPRSTLKAALYSAKLPTPTP